MLKKQCACALTKFYRGQIMLPKESSLILTHVRRGVLLAAQSGTKYGYKVMHSRLWL
jgi:hypothetical protein